MQLMFQGVSCVFAFMGGCILGSELFCQMQARKRKAQMRSLVSARESNALEGLLEVKGLAARILSYAIALSKNNSYRLPAFLNRKGSYDAQITKAGLKDVMTSEGLRVSSIRLACYGLIAGGICGSFFSSLLGIMLALCCAALGWFWPRRALSEQIRERSHVAERQFSQMVEIVILGLQSGMTFDRSISLYCSAFNGSLSKSLQLAQSQWSHGLCGRNDALKSLAGTYDSVLFDRFAENVIRSLRFGTSLADNLNTLATEARLTRKSKLEETVAKAPVKMLLPVGTLILPAMLIYIMGPIMLDLIQGM